MSKLRDESEKTYIDGVSIFVRAKVDCDFGKWVVLDPVAVTTALEKATDPLVMEFERRCALIVSAELRKMGGVPEDAQARVTLGREVEPGAVLNTSVPPMTEKRGGGRYNGFWSRLRGRLS